ncbi:MAG: M20 family metallopeptidase [Nocardioidaceae bacterium]|nr:M20 family metallopeptidase [Nocardioidaceae bacterium]
MISSDNVIRDTQSLVRIDSQNPGPLEAACADWVEQRLLAADIKVQRQPVAEGRDNLVAVVPGNPDAPRLVLLAHLDTVPVGAGWTRDPFGGEIADGRIYGRGTCDMKGGLALAINVLETLSKNPLPNVGDVVLVATVDEEAPGMLGAHALVASGFLRPDDQVLAPEPTGMRLRIAQMGLRWITVRIHGRMAHAGRAHLGIDANHLLAEIVSRLKVTFAGMDVEDPLLGKPRFTCGTFTGGVATNVVPPTAEANLDLRIVPPMTIDDLELLVREHVDAVLAEHPGATADIEMLGAARPPVRAAEDAKIVRLLRSSYQAHTGTELPSGGADGHEAYTDASMVATLTGSSSCTVFGPGATDQAHTADEFVPLADLVLGTQVLWSMLEAW